MSGQDSAFVTSAIFTAFSVERMLAGAKTHTRRHAWQHDRFGTDDRVPAKTPWQRRKRGDLVWVREPYAIVDGMHVWQAGFPGTIPEGRPVTVEALLRVGVAGIKWSTPLYLPRVRSRATLCIRSTRLERLQDITEADCLREGVLKIAPAHRKGCRGQPPARYATQADCPYEEGAPTARAAFEHLWASIHGRKAWDANPEVVVVSFDAIAENVDAYMARFNLTQRNKRCDRNAQPAAA